MRTLLVVMFALLSGGTAKAGMGFDGCYQLYLPSVMYPAFCLQGTAEEGINGAGVRLAIFGTNTNKIIHCSRSTGSGMNRTSFSYDRAGKTELILQNVTNVSGRKEGEAVLGSSKLKFFELDKANTDRLMGIANSNPTCR